MTNTDPPVLGDVDGDGEVTAIDATFIRRALALMPLADVVDLEYADVDGDDWITIMDVTYIQQYLANVDTPYAIGMPVS